MYKAGISIASNWNGKAKKWVDGRQDWQSNLVEHWKTSPADFVVWMHCASLGEFEQGRPIIEKIKLENPGSKILLTFFSPSGYEIRKNYELADLVMYLPFDSEENAKTFLDIINPKLVLFVKYDFWHFYLQELKHRKIETILVSGIFRSSQPFFSWWGSFHRNMLQSFTHLFVQNMESKELLNKIGLGEHTTVAGDTRFDRVLATAQQWKPVEQIEHFIDHTKKVLVAGSTWKEDENLLADWFKENEKEWQLIIAPHEIKAENITRLKTLFPNAMCFSEIDLNRSGKNAGSCLIIDNIGYLSKLYHYATLCYVGGGFNTSGHHNIIEAAVYGKCVITGPYYLKFKESVDLKKMGASFTVENSKQLTKLIQTLNIKASGRIAALYVEENSGATDKIYHWIQEKRLFTKA